jgi:hypothetical protein
MEGRGGCNSFPELYVQGTLNAYFVVQANTAKFALLMVQICGFGIPFKWSAPPEANDGSMTLQEAMSVVNESFLWAAFAPWALQLPFAKLVLAKFPCRRASHVITGSVG